MGMNEVFKTLNQIDVNGHTEQKNGLTYLSWAWAWTEVKKNFPDASYTIYENNDGWNYHTDGKTAWVKTGVTINCLEHIEYLPVMDYRNASIPLDKITSFDVNKAIQRSLTKACARHGLGLYIYAGEDLPETPSEQPTPQPKSTEVEMIKKLISECTTTAMLKKVYDNNVLIQKSAELLKLMTSRKEEILNGKSK